MELREIGPLSCAKVLGLFYAVIGLVAGLLVGFITVAGVAFGGRGDHVNPLVGSLFGVGAIVFLPLLYGTLGVLGGLLLSALYNLIARLVGGIQVTLQ